MLDNQQSPTRSRANESKMDLDLDQVEENSNDDYGDDEIRP